MKSAENLENNFHYFHGDFPIFFISYNYEKFDVLFLFSEILGLIGETLTKTN